MARPKKDRWKKADTKILKSHLEAWQAAVDDPEKREREIAAAVGELEQERGYRFDESWKERVDKWYHERRPDGEKRKKPMFKVGRKVTWQMVLAREEKESLDERIAEIGDGEEQDRKKYPAIYQKALAALARDVSAADRARYKATADKWMMKGCPRDVQLKNIQNKLDRWIEEIEAQIWKLTGARLFILAAFQGKEKPNVTFFDHNDKIGTRRRTGQPCVRFVERHPRFREGHTYEYFLEYAEYAFDTSPIEADDQESEEEAPAVEPELTFDDDDYPLLPPPDDACFAKLQQRRMFIKQFVRVTYERYVGRSARVPWLALATNSNDYIDPVYLPEDIILRDPEKLRQDEIGALIRHWRTRQQEGTPVLRFKAYRNGEGIAQERIILPPPPPSPPRPQRRRERAESSQPVAGPSRLPRQQRQSKAGPSGQRLESSTSGSESSEPRHAVQMTRLRKRDQSSSSSSSESRTSNGSESSSDTSTSNDDDEDDDDNGDTTGPEDGDDEDEDRPSSRSLIPARKKGKGKAKDEDEEEENDSSPRRQIPAKKRSKHRDEEEDDGEQDPPASSRRINARKKGKGRAEEEEDDDEDAQSSSGRTSAKKRGKGKAADAPPLRTYATREKPGPAGIVRRKETGSAMTGTSDGQSRAVGRSNRQEQRSVAGTSNRSNQRRPRTPDNWSPAEVGATFEARQAFLLELSRHPTFKQMVAAIPNLPEVGSWKSAPKFEWATWSYPEAYCNRAIHQEKVLLKVFRGWLTRHRTNLDTNTMGREDAQAMALAIGMLARDVEEHYDARVQLRYEADHVKTTKLPETFVETDLIPRCADILQRWQDVAAMNENGKRTRTETAMENAPATGSQRRKLNTENTGAETREVKKPVKRVPKGSHRGKKRG
ncbi:hypothetical protein EVJ58_g1717 [Rhodofomes roseus]|uniref:Uncharacterized protein n=1 Tax=Rhodofomes roseus TaxID=34475 RepID=A0A4Y9Z072_9APHY|nr:hypothetical protein EVJ58_g1717 [Rhodofomes roseus]